MLEQIREVLNDTLQLGDRAANFTESTPLLGSVAEFDSMAVVSVLTTLEERFGISIEDDEIDAEVFETIGSLCRFVEGKVSA